MALKTVYLDHAAATPLDDDVLKVMEPYFSQHFYNPSAAYTPAKKVRQSVEAARTQIASIIGAKSSEIIFTAGGSEANNLAISGVMASYPKAKLIISAIEHPSVTSPAQKYHTVTCPVKPDGLVEVDSLVKLIDDSTVLVSIIYVSNEIGVIEPLSDICKALKEIRTSRLERGIKLPLYFHSDAAQAANYLDLQVARLGVDLMTLNGGKIYGPKQSGLLYLKSGTTLSPLIYGGGQERGLRSGTENIAGIVGLTTALTKAQASRKVNWQKTKTLQDYMITKLKTDLPKAKINGSLNKRAVNNLHLTIPGIDNEWLLIKLDEAGIMAAAGSACSASSAEPSSVLKAIGLNDAEARSSLRFSLGHENTKSDIDYTLETLRKLSHQKLRI